MRRLTSLLPIETVHKSRKILGLFFIVWQISFIVSFQFAFSNHATANVITTHGLDKGDQNQEDQLFHQGMQAYMDSNYQQAYTAWSKAAENNHPKSTFNVGRMWLQGLVPGQSENKQQALTFFQQAANLGYAPAEKYLKSNPENLVDTQASNVTKNQSSNLEENNQSESTIIQVDRSDADNTWLKNYSDNAWVIQIFASQDPNLLKQMIRDYSLKDKAQILTEKIENKLWYKLIYGQYVTKQDALDARQSLPERLRKEKPWVRSVSAMKNAQ